MSAVACNLFYNSGALPQKDEYFSEIFWRAKSVFKIHESKTECQAFTPDEIDALELVVMLTRYAVLKQIVISDALFSSLPETLKKIESVLSHMEDGDESGKKAINKVTKVYKELSEILCVVSIQKDIALHELLAREDADAMCTCDNKNLQ